MKVTEDCLDSKLSGARTDIEPWFDQQTQWISGQVRKLIAWLTGLATSVAGLAVGYW